MKQENKTIQLQIRLDWSREFDENIFRFHPHVLLEHSFRKSWKVKSVSREYSTIFMHTICSEIVQQAGHSGGG